jgi:hypothetical protein
MSSIWLWSALRLAGVGISLIETIHGYAANGLGNGD